MLRRSGVQDLQRRAAQVERESVLQQKRQAAVDRESIRGTPDEWCPDWLLVIVAMCISIMAGRWYWSLTHGKDNHWMFATPKGGYQQSEWDRSQTKWVGHDHPEHPQHGENV